jgi:hypothetical protein
LPRKNGIGGDPSQLAARWFIRLPHLKVKPPQFFGVAMSARDPLHACVSADGLEVFDAKLEKAANEQKRLK